MVEVTIKLWGNLGHYVPAYRGKFAVRRPLRAGQTVQELVDELGLPKDMDLMIAVNEMVVDDPSITLEEGDEIALFRPASGG
jgi:molybdopterin converting factor small subunit